MTLPEIQIDHKVFKDRTDSWAKKKKAIFTMRNGSRVKAVDYIRTLASQLPPFNNALTGKRISHYDRMMTMYRSTGIEAIFIYVQAIKEVFDEQLAAAKAKEDVGHNEHSG